MGYLQCIEDNEKIARLCNWTQKGDAGAWYSPTLGGSQKSSILRTKSSRTLRFHEDISWLFEALDRIEKNGYTWTMEHHKRTVSDDRPHYAFYIYAVGILDGKLSTDSISLKPETAIFNTLVKLCNILNP